MRPTVLAALLLTACAAAPARKAAPPKAAGRRVMLEVPFYADHSDQCGPSALGSVLTFWGRKGDPADLKREIYIPHLKGSLPVDLILAAQSRGMSVRMVEGSMPKLKSELKRGHPLIAFINQGFGFFPVWHYVVLTGFDDAEKRVYMHSGLKQNLALPYARFSKEWSGGERWALLIVPRR